MRTDSVNWNARTYVMGILNLTPDSFSGDGLRREHAGNPLEIARTFIEAGVDILDLGGESTRPGASVVTEEEELARVLPTLRALRTHFPNILISIDTYKAGVAAAALDAGADIVNDVWGLRADPAMAALIAARGVPIILMHNRLTPNSAEVRARLGGRYVGVAYANLIEDVRKELLMSVALAHHAGVRDSQIILDPGIGFGKTVDQSLELLNRVDEIRALGYPVLIGPSRKSFIGYTLDLPPGDRIEGTAATIAIAIARGASIIRVHDVREMVRVARMADAIVRSGRNA